MKNIIKKLLREGLLDEERFDMNHLDNKTILVLSNTSLTLYNTQFWASETPEEGVLGFIAIGNHKGNLYVELASAKKGYGPLMYELAMQSVYDNPLMPDYEGNTNRKALRIWEYFYNGNNSDVKVIELKEGDDGYRDMIGYNDVDEDVKHLFNSRFYMEPDELYMLESNTEDFFDEIGNYSENSKFINKIGHDMFDKMY
jgi:hypothetical protein